MHLYNVAKREKEHHKVSETSNKLDHKDQIGTVDPDVSENTTVGNPPATEVSGNRRRNLGLGLIGGSAGLAILIGSIIGVEASNNNGTHPSKTVESSAPVNPSESPAPKPSNTVEVQPGANIAQHEIKANQDPQALSQNILEEISNWEMAGSDTVSKDLDDQIRKTADGSDEAISKFLDEYTAKQAEIFAPALFGADYKSDPTIQKIVADAIAINKATLWNLTITEKETTPYSRSMQFTSLVDSSATSLTINFAEKDNAGQGNRITDSVNGSVGRLTVNYEVQDNIVVIKTLDYSS